jgi:MFS family permease
VDRGHAKVMNIGGMFLFVVSLWLYSVLLTPDQNLAVLLIPGAVLGVANAGLWGPLATLATRNLPPQLAGAGSGIYNTTRQIGAVLGSAAIATFMQARLADNLPARPGGGGQSTSALAAGQLPSFLQSGFTTAMAQSVLLPAGILVIGVLVAFFFVKVRPAAGRPAQTGAPEGSPVEAERP